MANMLFKNVRIENRTELSDVLVSAGKIARITPAGSETARVDNSAAPAGNNAAPASNGTAPESGSAASESAGATQTSQTSQTLQATQTAESPQAPETTVYDARGQLMLPPIVESHVHLDTTMTEGDPRSNSSGTLFEGIEIWAERKQQLTVADVKERALRAIRQQVRFGVQYIRSHVDVTDPELTALRALIELREELRDTVTLQLVAFPQEGIESYPRGRELLRQAAELGADAIGAIPHYEFTREYSVSSLQYAFALAQEYGLLMDVHCDEIDDPASRGLETLATLAYEAGVGEKVTASHTTAMHSYNNAYFGKLLRLLRMSGINFVSNPMVNTHLQGRIDTYPKRRGVTRVPELTAAGINVSFGQDDIVDPWNPLGTGSLRDVTLIGLYVTQMMGAEQIDNSYRFITYNGARTLHVPEAEYGIAEGKPANFLLLDAPSWREALMFHAPVLASYREGRLLYEATAPTRHWHF
ncbi:cytosine deaminase [Actinobaculum suis]|uniref:cytosine deaminase n=1 Tax=Actinobaculum suis TaxID=1657 RepID=UPI000AA19850|nr:cytosine deaminase [Actinobaculum suis]